MTSEFTPITCAEFEARLTDYVDGALDRAAREAMDLHRLDCDACDALAADVMKIRADAAKLPLLSPSRDLWDGIASRIEAEVVEFPITPLPGTVPVTRPVAVETPVVPAVPGAAAVTIVRNDIRVPAWRIAAAAGILVAVTAGVTWRMAARDAAIAEVRADTGFASAMDETRNVRLASAPAMNETYDREIAGLRRIVDERRSELDSATVTVLERNLKVIDAAIAESKAALASNPASAFLLDQLSAAYDSKLRVLRAVATLPPRA